MIRNKIDFCKSKLDWQQNWNNDILEIGRQINRETDRQMIDK